MKLPKASRNIGRRASKIEVLRQRIALEDGCGPSNPRHDFGIERRPVTLPRVKWLERPVPEITPREVLGAKTRKDAPSSAEYLRNLRAMRSGKVDPNTTSGVASMISKGGTTAPSTQVTSTQAELDDGVALLEGEIAWKRLRSSSTLSDWCAVGRALLVLRKQATEEVGNYKGIKYSKANAALLDKHGFREISHSARQSAMQMIENWNKIEPWLSEYQTDRRLNHPQVIVAGWRASQRPRPDNNRHATDKTWRNREPLQPSAFDRVYKAIRPMLPDKDEDAIRELSIVAVRAMGFAVPGSVYRRLNKRTEERVAHEN
jgi:hypothetical protein